MKIPAILASTVLTGTLANLPDYIGTPKNADFALAKGFNGTHEFSKATGSEGVSNYGDVVLTKEQEEEIFTKKPVQPGTTPGSRSFKRPARIWDQYPKNGRFRIAVKVDRNSFSRLREINNFDRDYPEAVKDFMAKTGIELGYHADYNYAGNPNRGDDDWDHEHWLMLTGASNQGLGGCSSWMGRMGNWRDRSIGLGNGEQQISLKRGCHYKNTIMHEIIHALGWTHEQNREDRDDFITVNWGSIHPSFRSQFKLAVGSDASGTPYDPQSVMHYHDQSFSSVRGAKTMVSLTDTAVISSPDTYNRNGAFQKRGLSDLDAYEINVQYNLNEHCKSRGMVWVLWDQSAGKPKKGARAPNADSCVSTRKRQRFAGCAVKNPCESGFTCVDVIPSPGYECKENVIDQCDDSPCRNGGTCNSETNSGENPLPFTCQCRGDWFGRYCENRISCLGEQEIMFDEKMQMTRLCEPFTGFVGNKIIDLSGRNNIRGINKKTFSMRKFQNAKNLKLHRSMISYLDAAAFQELEELKKINLKNNKLTSLPRDLFNSNTNLQTLNLQNNQLSGALPAGVVVKSIKYLYLNDNPELELNQNTFKDLSNAKEVFIYNTNESSRTLKNLCNEMKRTRKVSGKCCYEVTQNAFGVEIPKCA